MSKKAQFFCVSQGARDVLPQEQDYWEKIKRVIHSLAYSYGFEKINPPILENLDFLSKAKGKAANIVDEKEMCLLRMKAGEKVVLRPEITFSCIRACLDNNLLEEFRPAKFYTFGPIFRYDNLSDKGFCQIHQANFEVIGSEEPIIDAYLIQLCYIILSKELGLKNLIVQINSLGCKKCGVNYRRSLINFFKKHQLDLCQNCQKIALSDPLRVFACHDLNCQEIAKEAPQMIEYLCKDCRSHFKSVLEYLDELDVPYLLVSGLPKSSAYHTRTVFNIIPESEEKGEQFYISGGGRYDDLVKCLGGKEKPGAGFVLELDEIVKLMKHRGIKNYCRRKPLVFLVQIGELGRKKSLKLFENLRKSNIEITSAFDQNNLNAQLKEAERLNARFSLILGQKEALDDTIIIKDMETDSQEVVLAAKIVSELRKKIRKQV